MGANISENPLGASISSDKSLAAEASSERRESRRTPTKNTNIKDELSGKNWIKSEITSMHKKYGYFGTLIFEREEGDKKKQDLIFKTQYNHFAGNSHSGEIILLSVQAQREIMNYIKRNLG